VGHGIIEYIDAEEEENVLVSLSSEDLTPEHTHLEISPYTILGICASTIPYAEHNQSPRNSYESAMSKQALGMYATNFPLRVDSRSHIMHYPQKPLVKTEPMDLIGYNLRPSGQNCVVAVLSFEGYNMEDALIFNKASIERGLMRSTFYRMYDAECRQYLGGLRDRFVIPESGIRGYRGEQYYRLLEADGVVSLESAVSGNDVLIGRISPPRFLEEYKEFEIRGPTMRDSSVDMRPSEKGFVDAIFITETNEGELKKMLVDLGFSYTGRDVLYDGITGDKFEADIFIGIVYYQKLHHMVADKIHARARGQVQMLTRQPTEGRARGGGLRFGEMERDCLIGHGAAMLLRDRLLEESDKYILYVCESCGYYAYYDIKERRYVCQICGDRGQVTPVVVSYAFKLLLQELMSLCISPRLELKERS